MTTNTKHVKTRLEMKALTIAFLTITIFYTLSGCTEKANCHKKINIINNSDTDIYYYFQQGNYDTAITRASYLQADELKILKHNRTIDYRFQCMEGDFNYQPKIICFVYDAQVIENIPFETIRDKYLLLKRYDLTLDYMQRVNWTITYP